MAEESQSLALPFGDPDGARALLDDVLDGFVRFGHNPVFGGISVSPDNRSTRVIVGKKGAGKTVYLRRFQNSTREEESVFSASIQQDVPTTSQVVSFCEMFDNEQLTEKWQLAWRCAILRALTSHLLHKKYFSEYIETRGRRSLLEHFDQLLSDYSTPQSVYNEIRTIITKFRTARSFTDFSEDPRWFNLQAALADCPSSEFLGQRAASFKGGSGSSG